ncbi:signal peptidase I [Halomicrobium sp. LC1Hm]|uniref:signal peptidase I n=1 Tax=Halomicrobium sp. LC1Hm TaxID=2610902 RepID=UPI0012985222|nr:signal peptidase I [Halomicrobium sp. LC1Hm]QGA81661.1 Signal peptidase I [Halomicrobium sp. LC1Hm]
MSVRATVGTALEVAAIVAVAALVLGAILGQPILFSYVETGSMEPTIDTGDGFVAVPSVLAGSVDEGDVVVYEARELQGGGLTTHRVVGETDEGYITKGDANPFTDQDGPEPPVTDDQIVAHALQIDGTVVVIPALGVGVGAVQEGVLALQSSFAQLVGFGDSLDRQGSGVVLFAVGFVLFALTLVVDDDRKRSTERSRDRPGLLNARTATILLVLAVLVPANAAMLAGNGTQELVVDGDTVAQSPDIVPGDDATWEIGVDNYGLVPIVLVFEGESAGTSVLDEQLTVGPGQAATLSVSATAPEPGEQTVLSVTEYRYLHVLPAPVVAALHERHPLLALAAVNAVLMGVTTLVVSRVVGFRTVRVREGGNASLGTRLRRRLD